MPAAPAPSAAARASSTGEETGFRAQAAHPLENSLQRTSDLLAPGELPTGIIGPTTGSARPPGPSDSIQVPFGRHLQELCDELAARFGRSSGPRLTCEAADEGLPMRARTLFALIAEVLVTDAFVHGFPPGRGGQIAVSFTAGQEGWQLTVDDSGNAVRSPGDPRDENVGITRQLVLQVGGRLALAEVIGGTRCTVALPRVER